MSNTTGAPRAMMQDPSGHLGRYIRGMANIMAQLAKGWTILPSERNCLPDGFVENKAEQVTEEQPIERAKRPRIKTPHKQ